MVKGQKENTTYGRIIESFKFFARFFFHKFESHYLLVDESKDYFISLNSQAFTCIVGLIDLRKVLVQLNPSSY